jgi:hypothetical protein
MGVPKRKTTGAVMEIVNNQTNERRMRKEGISHNMNARNAAN